MSLEAVIAILAIVWFLVLSITIVLERRSAAATIASLLALFFLPFIGLVVYRLIGRHGLVGQAFQVTGDGLITRIDWK